MSKIVPTPGRVVLYFPTGKADPIPLAAIVSFVHGIEADGKQLINAACFDRNGNAFSASNLELLDMDKFPEDQPCFTWMPYQIGQAKKESDAADHTLSLAEQTKL